MDAGLIMLNGLMVIAFAILVSPLILYRYYRRRKGLPPPGANKEPRVKKKSAWSKEFKYTMAAIPAILVFLIVFGDDNGASAVAARKWDRNVEAMTAGQNAIRIQLKFPTTARFSEHKYGPLVGDEYYYTALVRAENSFGQKVPSYWYAIVEFHPGTAQVARIAEVRQTQ